MPTDTELEPPPRRVPSSVVARVVLGGTLPLVAWIYLAVGGFAATVVIGNAELFTSVPMTDTWETMRGSVLANETIPIRWNGAVVHRVEFSYQVGDRQLRELSYTTSPPSQPRADIEYSATDPSNARIRGGRSRPLPAAASWIAILPLTGLIALAVGLWVGRRRTRLLRHGDCTWGNLIGDTETTDSINDRPIHALEFAFTDREGRVRIARAKSHKAHLRDLNATCHILFDPNSDRSIVLEAMPGSPRVGDDGRLSPMPAREVIRVSILPAIAVLATASGLLFIY